MNKKFGEMFLMAAKCLKNEKTITEGFKKFCISDQFAFSWPFSAQNVMANNFLAPKSTGIT
jgi:hypothetical protein